MKSLKYIAVLTLTLILFTLAGCNSFNKVKGDMEDAGYTYNEEAGTQVADLLEEFEENDVTVAAHFFSKGLNFPIVLEFSSTKEMNKQIEESETLKGFLKDTQKSDYVRGNCILISIGLNQSEMINAFQGKDVSSKNSR